MTTVDDAQQLVRTAPGAHVPVVGGVPPAQSVEVGGGFGAGDIWRVLKQRKLLISLAFVVLYMLVIAGTYLVWRFAPTYTSTGFVKLQPPAEGLSLDERVYPKDYVQQRLNTETAALTSYDTLLDLLKQEEIKATQFYKWYGEGGKGQMDCLFALQDLLKVSPLRDSYLIKTSLATRERSEATLIVNTLIQRYIERSRSSATDDRRSRLNQLKQTEAEVQEQLDNVRRRITDLRAQRDMPALEAERDVLTEMVTLLSNTRAELLAREADIKAQLDTVRGVDIRNLPVSAEMKLAVENDPEVRMYRQQVEALDIEIRVMKENMLGDEHRQMRQLRARREEYFQKEMARREQLVDDLRARQVESLEQEIQRIRNTLIQVSDQLAEKENEQRDLDSAITLLESLQKDEERYDRELQEIALKVREAEHQHTVQAQKGTMGIAALAQDATSPTRPQPVIYLGGGFVLSIMIAMGLAFLREFSDQSLRTPVDVARHGRLSVLGCVPMLDDEEADIEEIELATRTAPQSLVSEAFRQIRAHLIFSGPLESQHCLLITSPRPEDGKTAVAINLAATFAQGDQRTLLVDCNFRRPGMRTETAFPNAKPEGLSNVLIGHSSLSDAISPTEVPNLDVLTSGPMPPNPAELLGSAQMRALINEAKQSYERVILDGPPCLLMSDALVVAMQADAVVMVARAGHNTKGALRRAREQMQRINARVIGAILNGVQARAGGYFRQQYREFYEYASEEVVPPELTAGPREIESGLTDEAEDDERRET